MAAKTRHWFELPDGTPLTAYRLCVAEMDEAGREVSRQSFDFAMEGPPAQQEPPTQPEPEPTPQSPPEPETPPEAQPEPPTGPGISTTTIPRNARVGDVLADFVWPGLPEGVTWQAALESGGPDNGLVTVRGGRQLTLGRSIPAGKVSLAIRVEFRRYRSGARLAGADPDVDFDLTVK